jgi:hypothetical protein
MDVRQRGWRARGCMAVVVTVVFFAAMRSAPGEIYEWTDDEGRHFADSLEAVPEGARSKARLVVKAQEASSSPAAPVLDRGTQEEVDEGQSTQPEETTAFSSGWDRGFEAGWAAGYQAAREEEPVCPTEPEIVVLESPVFVNVPRYDPTGSFYVSPYAGTVSVPFDQGRSRGLTRREQIQRLQGR